MNGGAFRQVNPQREQGPVFIWMGSIGAAALVSFFIGALWYGALFGTAYQELRPGPEQLAMSLPVMAVEGIRCLCVAGAYAWLIHRLGINSLSESLVLAIVAWGGFQLLGLAGSVLHEGYSLKLYAIHMGDALAKSVASCLIIASIAKRFA